LKGELVMPDPVVTDDRGVSGTAGVVSDDDVFSAAFETAQGEEDKADLSTADDPKNLKEEEEPVVVPGPPVKTQAEVDAETQAAEAAKAAIPVDDAAKIEQKYKTLQGIHRHDKETWEEERTRLYAELEEARKIKTPDEKIVLPVVSKEFEENLTDDQKEELELYEENFDVVSKMEGLKRERELAKLRKDLQAWKDEITTQITTTRTQLEPALTLVQDRETDAHFDAIRDGYTLEDGTVVSGHGDYEKYVADGSLKTWIETKPAYIRRGMERVYGQGSVQDAIDLLSDFKRENNITTEVKPDNVVDLESKRGSKKAALIAVNTRKAAVAPGNSFVDDYDGAFDEALHKSGG
jgi:hypothetical protein